MNNAKNYVCRIEHKLTRLFSVCCFNIPNCIYMMHKTNYYDKLMTLGYLSYINLAWAEIYGLKQPPQLFAPH